MASKVIGIEIAAENVSLSDKQEDKFLPGQNNATESDDSRSTSRTFTCCGKKFRKESLLVFLTLVGVFSGITLGCLLRFLASPSPAVRAVVAFPGELLLRMLKLLAVPFLITSIFTSVTRFCSQNNGKMALQICVFYLSTTFFATTTGSLVTILVRPGSDETIGKYFREHQSFDEAPEALSTLDVSLDMIRNLVPANMVSAWIELDYTKVIPTSQRNDSTNATTAPTKTLAHQRGTNLLGLLVFIICMALASHDKPIVKSFFDELNDILLRMVMKVMWYAPLGICCLIMKSIVESQNITDVMQFLGWYCIALVSGLTFHAILLLPGIYWIITRKNPFRIYAGIDQALLTAFGTTSSGATLPMTTYCLEENLHIDKRITRLVLPLGAVINMDGTALMQSVVAMSVAQMVGRQFGFVQVLVVSITGAMASIGAATTPGTALVVAVIVLQSVGLPIEAIAYFYSVDWLMERLRVLVNIMGDAIGTGIIAHLNPQITTCEEGFQEGHDQIMESEKRSNLFV